MSRRPGVRPAAAVLLLVLAMVVSGCASMPDSGPIVAAQVPLPADDARASDIDPLPPAPDDTPTEIAQGFLDAMTASPIRTDVARQYLTAGADASWSPERSTITYSDQPSYRDEGGAVTVGLLDANRLDATGAWRGRLTPAQERLRLTIVPDQQGQYRISDPPDALVVPDFWFAQRFQRVSLYFLDRTARILVPQPVFVPRGDQFATSLVDALLAGPGPDLARTVRTFLAPELTLDRLSVPVSSAGVADISLTGPPGHLTPDTITRLLAQLAWTLRQVPGISALRLAIGDRAVPLPGGEDSYPLDQAAPFDPTGYLASTRLYALQQGLLRTSSNGAAFGPTAGPLGVRRHRLRSVTVDLAGKQVAAVTADGTSVLEAATAIPGSSDGSESTSGDVVVDTQTARRVVRGAVDLLAPAWDYSGRLWLVDRNRGRASVSFLDRGGRRHVLAVPGVTGRAVRSFLVSRDGTRLVAVVAGRRTDVLRISRIADDVRGRPVAAGASTVLAGTAADPVRIRDVAWTSATTIGLLVPLPGSRVAEVRTESVDGSPTSPDDLATTVSGSVGPVLGLAGTPTPDKAPYAVTRTSLVDLSTGTAAGSLPLSSVDYVG